MADQKTSPKREGPIKAIALVGVLLLITGIGLWLYTDWVIRGHEQILKNPNLTQDQRYRWEGSLQWWKDTKIRGYGPLAIFLITVGLCALEYSIIYALVRPQRKTSTLEKDAKQDGDDKNVKT